MSLKFSLALLKHGSLWCYRIATWAVLIAGVGFVALVLGLRYLLLPNIDDYREPIARAVSEAAGQRVSIGQITGSWKAYRPELRFENVEVFDSQDRPVLALGRVQAVLSWLSLLSAQVRFDSLEIDTPELAVRRDPAGVLWVAGIAVGQGQGDSGFSDWLLAQRQLLVRNAHIVWQDEARGAPELELNGVDFRLDSDGEVHRFGLTGSPPSEVASRVMVRGELQGRSARDLQAWRGKLYAEVGYANLALLQSWIPVPIELTRGLGALRVWLDLAGPRVVSATADVRLVNLRGRLAPELPELELAGMQGRLGWKKDADRTEISTEALGFTTVEGLQLAPMRLVYSRSGLASGVSKSDLQIEKLDLAPAIQLAEFLPLDPALRARLARLAPGGMVEQAALAWERDWDLSRPYRIRARFSDLALRPDGAIPGFRGIDGQFDASERGGTISLSAREAGIDLPKLFESALPVDFLTAEAEWTFRDGRTFVTLKSAAFTNEHLAGSARGSYHTDPQGPGTIDLSGTLVRADARQVWRYVPVTVGTTQSWLKRALRAGEARDTRFRLKGPLADFPFADGKAGVFEVFTHARGVTLDFADGWPELTGINGDVIFRGSRMEIVPQAVSVMGLNLSNVNVSIPDLGSTDRRLLVKGFAEGPTAEFLRYVSSSPVSGYIGGVTRDIKAQGAARLGLDLDLPLKQLDKSRVAGELTLRDNRVTVDRRLPPLDAFGARIAFTEKGVSIKDGRAQLYGNPFSFEASGQGEGGMTLNLAGTLEAAKLRSAVDQPLLRFVDGQAAWRGRIVLRDKVAALRFDSNLVGLDSKLPPPFTKAAGASLPLRVELSERPGREQLLAIALGNVASAQLLLDASEADGIKRGMLSFGAAASLPAADGLWVNGKLDVVDVDVWRGLVPAGGSDGGTDVAGINLKIGSLDASGRRFHDLKIDATLQDATWQATLSGPEIAGQVSWAPAGDGRLAAKLSKFTLPALTTSVQAAAPANFPNERLPSVDLSAEDFVFEGKNLGRLVVLASPQLAGWQLQRLEIVNPESKLNVSGRWTLADASRTDVVVHLEVNDIGKFFGRFGWPEGVKGGTALLEGPVAWRGAPYRLDIPSLSGQLRLEAKDGRFRQIEPGVAKLLGILSLQAIPRRATLDFQDVFSKGFTFDKISADLKVSNGVVHTENFNMEGSAARVSMRGDVDLAGETQHLNVRVIPSLSESIAVAGAIVNPAIGVAAYLAQKALKDPFGKMAAFDYSVTGTWADPVVARVSKPAPPVESKGR